MSVGNEQLVTAALAGDAGAFATLVEQNRARVQAVVERMAGEDAEDVVQEALLRAYLGLSQLRDPRRFEPWLCGIAVNLAKMRLRRRALERRVPVEDVSNGAGEERELLELVRNAVDVLPDGQREAVLMHYLDDLSCEEIAALLGTSSGAIRVRLHRARLQLREQLAPLAPSPMPKEEILMIEMRLHDVLLRVDEDDPAKPVTEHRVVVLREVEGERSLPIWIGAGEGNALAVHLTGETTPRPLTTDLIAQLVRATGAHVDHVAVTALRDKIFYGSISIAIDGRVDELDARPSDALNLAVRVGAPILVDDGVLDQGGVVGDSLADRLDTETLEAGEELPAGEWRSLSAELLQSLYRWR